MFVLQKIKLKLLVLLTNLLNLFGFDVVLTTNKLVSVIWQIVWSRMHLAATYYIIISLIIISMIYHKDFAEK